jgi:hypothetical protein
MWVSFGALVISRFDNMKRHQMIKVAVVLGLLMVGLFLIKSLSPVPAKSVAQGKRAEVDVQSPHFGSTNPTTTSLEGDLNRKAPSSPPPVNPWEDKLAALHDIGELFGVGAEDRMKQLQDFVESLPADDVPAVVKELQVMQTQNPTATGRDLLLRLLQSWARSDMRAAADWTAQMPAGSDRQEALVTMAGAWAGQNFEEATAWVGQLPDKTERQTVLQGVSDAAVYVNPVDALKLAGSLDETPARDDTIARAAGVWAIKAPGDAVSWAKQIPDDALREQVISSVATSWGEQDPVAAANLAINSMSPGPLQDRAVAGIVQRWGIVDAAGAAAWVNQFPEGTLRQTATAMLDQIAEHNNPTAQ